MSLAIPSLSSALSSLLKPLTPAVQTPAIPKTTNSSVYSPAPAASSGGVSYMIQPGDTLSSIASRYGTTAAALASANNISNPNIIKAGSGLSIPGGGYSTPAMPNLSASAAAANATAAKGTVPYVPATATTGGMSVMPTATSVKTGLPTNPAVPNAITPSNASAYKAPVLPAVPNIQTATKAANASPTPGSAVGGTTAPATPSFSAPSSPSSPSLGGAYSSPSGAGAGGGLSSGGSTFGGSVLGAGTDQPYLPDLSGQGGQGSSLFYSPEQDAALKAYMASLSMSPEEEAATKQLNALESSFQQGYTNTQGQAIPMPFITGQQAQMQKQAQLAATPLEQEISLLQAKRQLAGESSKAALDVASSRLSAMQDFAKPVATAYGGTLSRYNPATGQYETVVNPFGTATGTATGQGADVTSQIGQAIANGQLTSDQVTRYGIPFIAATLAADPGYNFVTQKASVAANSASLKTQQAYVDTVTRAFNTANDNLSSLQTFMSQYGLNQSSIPMVNQLQNKVKAGVTDAGTIAAFNSALSGLRAEYAQVLSRGGEVTDSARATAASLIPDNISPAQLAQVAERLNTEGANAIKEATAQVQTITSRVGGNQGGSGGDPSNPFSAANFFGT